MNWTTRFFIASLLMLASTVGYGAVRVFGAAYQNLASNASPQTAQFRGAGVNAFDMQVGGVSATVNLLNSSFSSDEDKPITSNNRMSMAPVAAVMVTPSPSSHDDDQDDQGEDMSSDVRGTVTAVNGNMVTVNGQTYTLSNSSEVNGHFQVGSNVKLEYHMNSDGTMTIEELKVFNSNKNNNSSSSNFSPNNSNSNSNGSSCNDECDDGSGDD